MKLHLRKGDKKETLCGGRISGIKSTGQKQFFDVDLKWFLEAPTEDRCIKCQSAYESLPEEQKSNR